MNKYIDVMRQATDLSDTCLEGLEHIKSKLNQGEFDSTMMMFHDSANAFYQIHKSIQPVLKELPDNELEGHRGDGSFVLTKDIYLCLCLSWILMMQTLTLLE